MTTIVESAGLFQSTLPQGERRSSRISPGLSENFNPRSHKGSDVLTVKSFAYIVISIHAPTRGATYSVISLMAVPCYFNPRSHKGSDVIHALHLRFIRISIHAPTRGATIKVGVERSGCGISIHAPTRGATDGVKFSGSDITISIHAPTRGATRPGGAFLSLFDISIHAPTRGATPVSDPALHIITFQSTLPQGERPLAFPVAHQI